MSTFARPLIAEVPQKPEARYRWIDFLWLVALLFYLIWQVYKQDPDTWCIAGIILSFGLPDFLCAKFRDAQKPQKSIQSVFGNNKALVVICWVVAFGTILLAVLAGLGVPPMNEILGSWPEQFFDRVTLLPMALLYIVFLPVFRVATFIEKRIWLRCVWACAASLIALGILYF